MTAVVVIAVIFGFVFGMRRVRTWLADSSRRGPKPLYGPHNFDKFPYRVGDYMPHNYHWWKQAVDNGRTPIPSYGRPRRFTGDAACGHCEGYGAHMGYASEPPGSPDPQGGFLVESECRHCEGVGSAEAGRARVARERAQAEAERAQREAERAASYAAHPEVAAAERAAELEDQRRLGRICKTCGGSGTVYKQRFQRGFGVWTTVHKCGSCSGRGWR